MPELIPKQQIARIPNELIKCVDASSFELLEEIVNNWIEENSNIHIREIRPIAYSSQSCAKADEEITKWKYNTHFGVIIRYIPAKEFIPYEPIKCRFCEAMEDDRNGRWIKDQFICNECLMAKINK